MKLRLLSSTRTRAVDLLCLEAAFAMAFETWMGSTYLSGLAGELHVDIIFVTILSALPWIGSAGQLLSIGFLSKASSLKRYTLGLAWTGRSLWFIPIVAAAIWGWRSYNYSTSFPANAWFGLVAIVAMAAALIGSSSGIAWNSWMRGLIPVHFQARFFALRQRYVMFTLLFANVAAALILNLKVGDLHVGYFIIIVLAVLSAMASTTVLSKVPDARVERPRLTKTSLRAPFEDPEFRKVLAFAAIFNCTVFFCAPYFSYYYTKELHFSLGTVAIWTGLANLGNFVAATFWARKIDSSAESTRGLFSTLLVTGHIVALAPAWYIFPSAAAVQYIAPLEFFINGIAWSGFQLANTTLLFRTCPPGGNGTYFSVYSATVGFAGALGVILGGQAIHWLAPLGGFRALWLLGTLFRLAVLWTVLVPIKTRGGVGSPMAVVPRPPRTL